MTEQFDKAAKQAILGILEKHVGEDARIGRDRLRIEVSLRLGGGSFLISDQISDRKMRSLIEDLRFDDPQGAWICSSLKGGYFTARDFEELDRFTSADIHRAKKLFTRVRKQRETAGLTESKQLKLEI